MLVVAHLQGFVLCVIEVHAAVPTVSAKRHELAVGFSRITSSYRIVTVGKHPQDHQTQPPAHPHSAVKPCPQVPHLHVVCAAGRALCARCGVPTNAGAARWSV